MSAGADLTFELGGLSRSLMDAVAIWTEQPIAKPSGELLDVFDQLVSVGAIVPDVGTESPNVVVQWIGSVEDRIRRTVETRFATEPEEDIDFRIVLRTNAGWSELLLDLPTFSDAPYLFVDLAYHHTMSIGPFVIPGDTACAGCLAGRVRDRWGDDPPPEEPLVITRASLVAELIALETDNIAAGNPSYVNATSTWDLASGASKREPLYRVPKCPQCDLVPSGGRIRLPWIA